MQRREYQTHSAELSRGSVGTCDGPSCARTKCAGSSQHTLPSNGYVLFTRSF